MKQVFVFGNPDLPTDALPPRIAQELGRRFPALRFEVKDPNEEWDVPRDLVVVDTVLNIPKITLFDGLEHFERSANVSVHDFDAYANLRLLQKLGRLDRVRVIGIPPNMDPESATDEAAAIIGELI